MKTIMGILFLAFGLIVFNAVSFCQCTGCTSTNPATLPAEIVSGVRVCVTVDKTYLGDVDMNGGEIQVCSGAKITLNGNLRINSGKFRFSDCSSAQINGNVTNNIVGGVVILDNCNCPGAVANSGSWSGFPIVCGPLPVELLSFDASCGNNNEVNVAWVTASEINNSHFLLDRSTDVINWENITRIEGAGNSNEIKNYAYTDHLSSAGTYYYRLTQVDFDGATEVFDYKTVTCTNINGNNAEIKIYPNPATDVLVVQLPNSSGNSEFNIEIVNFSGQVMMNRLVYANQSAQQQFDISGLGNGIFMVRISNNSLSQSAKLIVNR